MNPPNQRNAQHDTKERQQKLADLPAEGHPEGHAHVLHEAKPEPLPNHVNLFAQLHIRLDQILDHLVNDDEQDSQQQESFPLG